MEPIQRHKNRVGQRLIVIAVSYTHLDVYKRQTLMRVPSRHRAAAWFRYPRTIVLLCSTVQNMLRVYKDVYKRQDTL